MKFRFEFHGGFKDGEVVTGDTEARALDGSAKVYLFLTHRGRVGARFSEWRPLTPGLLAKIFEQLAGPSSSAGGKLDRPISASFLFISFQHFSSKFDLRAADDYLTYVYEVTQREETKDEVVVHIKCIHEPKGNPLGTSLQ